MARKKEGENERRGLRFERYFTEEGKKPEDYFEWERRECQIKDDQERIIYNGKNLEFPRGWDKIGVKVVASKYFYTGDDKQNPTENSLKQLVRRVSSSISNHAVEQGIIKEKDGSSFQDEISYLAYSRKASFNSPVWFNVGLYDFYGIKENKKSDEEKSHWAIVDGKATKVDSYQRPQSAACVIQSVKDNMSSILELAKKEGMLFKYGSGTGTNFSALRGVHEPLTGGGYASGMISFMNIYDVGAKTIHSGGKTRRAAKMVICNDDHPDLLRFIFWKVNEEKKDFWLSANPVWGPRNASDLESEANKSVGGQNGNNSIRLTDKFMQAALSNEDWDLWFRTAERFEEEIEIPLEKYKDDRYLPDKRFIKKVTNRRKTINAGNALELITRAAYAIGEPGVQFHDNINRGNTCKNSGEIRASNPCSEFMFLDDSACNLASINLKEFKKEGGGFDITSFEKTVEIMIKSQETLVDYASYPSQIIAENSYNFRPLGLGYGNLGALLMSQGIGYGSERGQKFAAAITSLMTAKAYETSADLAKKLGAFNKFLENKEPMLNVLKEHRRYSQNLSSNDDMIQEIIKEANKTWDGAIRKGEEYGFRNAQVTLLAPTGTIGFKMGFDCTGIEPMPALVSSKGLAGGGKLEIGLKSSVKEGLESLGYKEKNLEKIILHIQEKNTVVGAPYLKKEHYNIFSTAFGKDNTISIDGHLDMMAAIQPFLSGAISKTVNLPKGSTIKDVKDIYVKAWKSGLKSIIPYVDGSKGIQPLMIQQETNEKELKWGERKKPQNPIERVGWNVTINGTGVHFIVGEYNDRPSKNSPADFFVEFGSSGSPYSADLTSWAKEASRNRQRGESIEEFIRHNKGSTSPINGWTQHQFIKKCSGIHDFFAKLIQLEYLGDTSICDEQLTEEDIEKLRCNVLGRRRRIEHFRSRINFIDGIMNKGEISEIYPLYEDEIEKGSVGISEIYCINCGYPTILSGANCRKCQNCGESGGCG